MQDDDNDTDFEHPFERLHNLEVYAMESNLTMMQMSERVKDHSQLGVKISSHMLEMIRHIDAMSSKIRELEVRLEQLENK